MLLIFTWFLFAAALLNLVGVGVFSWNSFVLCKEPVKKNSLTFYFYEFLLFIYLANDLRTIMNTSGYSVYFCLVEGILYIFLS